MVFLFCWLHQSQFASNTSPLRIKVSPSNILLTQKKGQLACMWLCYKVLTNWCEHSKWSFSHLCEALGVLIFQKRKEWNLMWGQFKEKSCFNMATPGTCAFI
jgi:hypothetical protein